MRLTTVGESPLEDVEGTFQQLSRIGCLAVKPRDWLRPWISTLPGAVRFSMQEARARRIVCRGKDSGARRPASTDADSAERDPVRGHRATQRNASVVWRLDRL
jgi:hypothetical protein